MDSGLWISNAEWGMAGVKSTPANDLGQGEKYARVQ